LVGSLLLFAAFVVALIPERGGYTSLRTADRGPFSGFSMMQNIVPLGLAALAVAAFYIAASRTDRSERPPRRSVWPMPYVLRARSCRTEGGYARPVMPLSARRGIPFRS